MKKIILLLVFLISLPFASVSVESFDNGSQNQSIPNIRIKNSGEAISNFMVYYYFSATDSKDISVDSYYLAGGNVSLKKIAANQYRLEIDLNGITLEKGQFFPSNGYLQLGLHYSDWSVWKNNDDFSNSSSNTPNPSLNNRIVVVSSDGELLAGNIPNVDNLELDPCVIKIYSKSQSEHNFGKYQLYAKNEGNIPITHFNFDVELTSERGQIPIVDGWYLPNATWNLEQKDSNSWILHFNVQNINLESGAIYPSEFGFSFGIHYADWSIFDSSNDYALSKINLDYQVNEKIPVYVDSVLVFGNPKIHDLIDIKKIIAAENGYTLEKFETPVESIFDTTLDIKMTWDELESIKNTFFESVPNFDTTSIAFFQILNKFSGLDTLYLAQNFKEIRNIYSQLVSLRFIDYINSLIMPKKSFSLKKISISGLYDKYKELNKYEIKLLVINPMKIPGSYRAYNRAKSWATEYAKDSTNGDTQHTRADGFRHSVWNALLCRETGTQYDDISDCLKWAKDFTNAHEKTSDEGMSKSMDLHNNKIGRDKYGPKLTVGCEWDWGFACVNEEVVGLSREETKQMYWKLADIAVAFNDEDQLNKNPWIRRIVFFKDKNGYFYCQGKENEGKCEPFVNPSLMADKIAVLKKDLSFTCNEEFSFRLDLEDDDNGSKIVSGDPNPPGIVVGDGGIIFTYCVLPMADFDYQIPRVPYDYIVLRMDNDCPEGTYAFNRHHDTEDSHNANTSTGDFGPNVVTKNATLEYCFVPADENSSLEYPFAKEYGVFANHSSTNIVHSKIYVDDEDSNNANSWGWYDTPSDIKEKIEVIMNGSSNTIYYVVKWIEIVLNKIMNWMGV
jgi:hypothetical protein